MFFGLEGFRFSMAEAYSLVEYTVGVSFLGSRHWYGADGAVADVAIEVGGPNVACGCILAPESLEEASSWTST